MGYSITLTDENNEVVYDRHFGYHYFNEFGDADLYTPIFHPDSLGATKARQLVVPLRDALVQIVRHSNELIAHHDAPEAFLEGVKYLITCEKYPDAEISVS